MARTDILHTHRDHRYQTRLLYPANLLIMLDGENEIFHDKTKFKQCMFANLVIQKKLDGKFQLK